MSRSVKVLFHARSAERESAWCAPAGKKDQYRLENILFLHPRPCLGDLVEAKEGEDGLVFKRVVTPSGRYTMIVDYPRRADFKVLVKFLRAKGVESEGLSGPGANGTPGRLYLAVPRALAAKELFRLAAERVPGLMGVVPRLGPRPPPLVKVAAKPETLFAAVARGDVKALERAKPAALRVTDDRGRSLLFVATLEGKTEIVKALLARGMDPNPRTKAPLYAAVMRNRPAEAKLLLAAGARPELAKDDDGDVALVVAAFRESMAVLRVLLSTGPSSTAHLSHALLEAAGVGNVPIVKLLLKHGADPDLKTSRGNSARSIAQKRRRREVLALFAR